TLRSVRRYGTRQAAREMPGKGQMHESDEEDPEYQRQHPVPPDLRTEEEKSEEITKAMIRMRRDAIEIDKQIKDPVFGHNTFVSARTLPRQLLAAVLEGDTDRIQELMMDSRMPLDAATTQYSYADTRTPLVEAFASCNTNHHGKVNDLVMTLLKWRFEHMHVGIDGEQFEPIQADENTGDDFLRKYAPTGRMKEPLLTQLIRRDVPLELIEKFRPVSLYLQRDEGELGDGVYEITQKAHAIKGDTDGTFCVFCEFYTIYDYGQAALQALRRGRCTLALDLARTKSVFNELITGIIQGTINASSSDIDGAQFENTTPYFVPHAAAVSGRTDVLDLHCSLYPTALNFKDEQGWTPIHYAAAAETPTALEWIIARGGTHQVNFRNDMVQTPLHVAVEAGRLENVKVLIAAIESLERLRIFPDHAAHVQHSSLNWKTTEGMSALHLAAAIGNFDIVLYLCCRPYIDFNSRDHEGRTPIMIAAGCGHFTCMEHISRCCTSQFDDMNRHAIMHAVINGHTEAVAYFLKVTTLELESVDTAHNTCLHYACAYGWLPIVKMLVEIDSSILVVQNGDGLTPPVCAFRNGYFGIISWLFENGFTQVVQDDPSTKVNIKEFIDKWKAAHND
ncbi:hypothetical protein PENTCL1PPCAC_20687, partial [Pristionchus entomophagus]